MLLLPNTPGNRVLALAFQSVEGMLDMASRSLDKYGLKKSVKLAIQRVKSGNRQKHNHNTEHDELDRLIGCGGSGRYLRLKVPSSLDHSSGYGVVS